MVMTGESNNGYDVRCFLTAGLYSRSNTNFFAAFNAFIIRMAQVARR
jgi:hypothetical protein